ncbi:MAG TPA: hypothetical protein VF132_06355 [Rudaea sp.]
MLRGTRAKRHAWERKNVGAVKRGGVLNVRNFNARKKVPTPTGSRHAPMT